MHPAIEALDIPEEFRNTEREWAVFEAPALQSQQQQEGRQHMPGELYFYERTIGISTWYQPMDLVVPTTTTGGGGGNNGAQATPVTLLLAAGREWQQQERQRRMERCRLKARQDRPSSQRALVGAPNWVAVDTVQGRTYYHNKGTGQSVWEKPRVDRGSSSNGEHEAKAEESGPEEAPPGTEFNAEDAEWMLAQMNGDNEEDEGGTETNINDGGPAVDSLPPASKAERELQFKQMLVDAAVDPFASWDTQARRFQHDKRVAWIPTEAERRDLFDEVAAQTLEKRREADAQTTQKQKQKQTALSPFDELLLEKVRGRMAFARFCQKSLEDPRYLSVKTSRERERRFKEFVDTTFGND
ncbi:hypothetical protein GGH99_004974 [Coemansia sp. RSA 1285]|nr:hypothetical protein EV177_001808 [Coemansia sp. RSA 1804]KAJ2681905.1 hypothetical protein GGH99_004974 [Coemansia sp. RSA 1285]